MQVPFEFNELSLSPLDPTYTKGPDYPLQLVTPQVCFLYDKGPPSIVISNQNLGLVVPLVDSPLGPMPLTYWAIII